ncbi:MAG: hypothetical protein JNK05_05325 [Myxococcales bacterium]|nr:hypothetical protein [Myxococcales bacterium]
MRSALLSLLLLCGCRAKWGQHDEATLCAGALRGSVAWPADACRAIHLCANEMNATPEQRAALERAWRAHRCGAF